MEEKREKAELVSDLKVNFQNGKTFKYYFQCRRADIFLQDAGSPACARVPGSQAEGAIYSFTSLIWIVGLEFV